MRNLQNAQLELDPVLSKLSNELSYIQTKLPVKKYDGLISL
jgi:hypothetical protein